MGMNMRLDHAFLWELDLEELSQYKELYLKWCEEIERIKSKKR